MYIPPLSCTSFLILALSMRATSMLSNVARNKRIVHSAKSSLSMVSTVPRPTKEEKDSQVDKRNLMEQISAAGIASAAVVAAAAVNQAVGKFSYTYV